MKTHKAATAAGGNKLPFPSLNKRSGQHVEQEAAGEGSGACGAAGNGGRSGQLCQCLRECQSAGKGVGFFLGWKSGNGYVR